ncbi:MAG TPA: GMC family oxidoreductase [Dehalococcoidia bacterium]|nr:GMC family oxidoreductase [Dehalococcoidia bacterium]
MPDRESDIVVIGSGPTGAAAALALADQHASITMLESGTSLPGGLVLQADGRNLIRRGRDVGNQHAYTSSTDPEIIWYHELAPGGLSNHWTCAVPRYHPDDFRDGERLHEKFRWPVTYDDLEPYYAQMEKVMGVSGSDTSPTVLPPPVLRHRRTLPSAWQPVSRIASARDRAFVPMPLATGRGWGVKSGGTPFNSFTDVVLGLKRAGRIKLRLGAHALRLEHDESGEVDRVVYFDRETNREASIGCQAVVVAAGTIASTKLLLDSTSSQFPSGLGNHNGLLGRFLHDHVLDMCAIELDQRLPRLGHEAYFTRAPQADSAPLLAAGCVLGGRLSALDRLLTLTPIPARVFGMIMFGTMVPLESNRVESHSATDEYGLPQVDIQIQFRDEDKATTRKARQDFLDILDEAGLGPRVRWNLDVLTPGAAVHFGGTVRMHDSPEYGLTNAWGRLHSVKNVVVADASVFTTCVEKNPTLTAMALGARSAERLALDLKSGSLG